MKLCDLETSKALQALGYDGEYQYCHVNACEDGYETLSVAECKEYESDIDNQCPAPRLDDAAYWLRERHALLIDITYLPSSRLYCPHISDMMGYYDSTYYYADAAAVYESVLESAVKTAIKIVTDRQR